MKKYKLYFGNGAICPLCGLRTLVDGGCLDINCNYSEDL